MKHVMQTKFGHGNGNCLLACVASILHRPIESIPDFNLSGCGWAEELYEWCGNEGIGLIQINYPDYGGTGLFRGYGIGIFSIEETPDEVHAMILEFCRTNANSESWTWGTVLEHDPNPNGVKVIDLKHIIVLIPPVTAKPEHSEGWVSVEERLPDVGVCVLCSDKDEVQDVAFRDDGKWKGSGRNLRKITHWQPLPAPPSSQPQSKETL